jgi:hypothetical protein
MQRKDKEEADSEHFFNEGMDLQTLPPVSFRGSLLLDHCGIYGVRFRPSSSRMDGRLYRKRLTGHFVQGIGNNLWVQLLTQ